jgi:hypothetical protein
MAHADARRPAVGDRAAQVKDFHPDRSGFPQVEEKNEEVPE